MTIPSSLLEGKVALVTGARMGMGKATALTFAEAGADVAICDIVADDGKMDAVVEEIRGFGRRTLAVKTDVSRKAEVDDFVKKALDEFGTVDIMVNNVGVTTGAPMGITELEEAEIERMLRINLFSVYFGCQAAAKIMVERKTGNIINLASTAAFRAFPDSTVYAIAKAGVVMLTRVLARQLGPNNIRVNAIAPGLIATEFLRPEMEVPNWDDPEVQKQSAARLNLPLGRVGDASEIGSVALFLASDLSSYMTGVTVYVEGGFLA